MHKRGENHRAKRANMFRTTGQPAQVEEQNLPALAKPFTVKRHRPINVTHFNHVLFSPRGCMKASSDAYCQLHLRHASKCHDVSVTEIHRAQARAQSPNHPQAWAVREVAKATEPVEPFDVTRAATAAQSQNEQTCGRPCGVL